MTAEDYAKLIPDEAVEAAARALAGDAKLNWDDISIAHSVLRSEARAACAAMLAAWPNATRDVLTPGDEPFLILPLPEVKP